MKRANLRKFGVAFIAVAVVIVVGWQLIKFINPAELLTEAEASEIVHEKYNGEIVEINHNEDVYEITFDLDTGSYKIEVNRETGNVDRLTRIPHEDADTVQIMTEAEIREIIHQEQNGDIKKLEKRAEGEQIFYYAIVKSDTEKTILKLNAESGEIVDSSTEKIVRPENSGTKLTSEEAIEIALQNVTGEVDNVDIEESNGQIYYLVEIEHEDDQEATVQINSISGEVMSITWDD